MADIEKKIWGIHTYDEALFLKDDKMAIGWKEIGNLREIPANRDDFKKKYVQVYPDASKGAVATCAGMLYRFCHEVQIGDYVVYPSKSDRMINIGEITGDYEFVPDAHEYVQQRNVKWLKHIPRTSFSQGALYEIGSALSFFAVKNYADEFLSALDKGFKKHAAANDEDDTVGATAEDIIESTKDFILKELSRNLKGYALEEFVADLLRAMGYRTTVSPQGGDSGIDITAYKDELPPRILVQVKSQDSDIKETTIQSLKGAMREGDYGLFVTLSNYTKNAQKYLESTPIIRGINGTELVDLILKYYEDLDIKYKKMIPLKMVYIPVPKQE
jgi:restriction system protein